MSEALTLQDVVSHVMDVRDLTENDVDLRRAVRSAVWGFQQATTRHQWSIYDTQFTAFFNGKVDDETISIDSAGVVTKDAGDDWPTWANLASVYIGEERAYRVKTRDSTTQLTLENWTGETESSITYVLRHDRVIIPDDVREVFDVWNESEDWSLRVVDAKTFRNYDRPRIYNGSDPYIVTFRSVLTNGVQQTELRISPGATTDTELDVAYLRRPRKPTILVEKRGSGSSDTVTLDTPLPLGANVVGSLVRLSDNESHATADMPFGILTPNQATFEGIVDSQASTTSLDVSGIGTFTSQPIVITDVLDIPIYLLNAVYMYAEAQMMRVGSNDLRSYRLLMNEADSELRYAMEQDAPIDRRNNQPVLYVDRVASMKDLYVVES